MTPPPDVAGTRSWIEDTILMLEELGPRAATVLDAILDEVPVHELAAVVHDFAGTWARPKQIIPPGDFRSFGCCTGRGWGKTLAVVAFAIDEVAAGRAQRLALVGQGEAKTIEILVTGETGILNLTPPWIGAEWESSSNRVLFGNGAIATVYTAQEPGGLRGPQHDLAIATEIAAWPAATREEAMQNLRLGLRLGRGQLLWDSTPRRRNPLIRERLALAAKDPARHIVITGSTRENAINLSPSAVAEWEEQWGGTARGDEELDGRFFDDEDGAMFKQAWIDRARRGMPDVLTRRVIAIDPAITDNPKYSDATGIMDMGLGVDGQVYVLQNLSGIHRAETWPGLVIDTYTRGGCDLVLVETNRAGTAWSALLRVAARERGLTLVELGPDEVPGRRPGVVYMRGRNVKGSKAARASGAAALCELGRVSFVVGKLGDLEDRLCTFDGTEKGPDDAIDAFVHGCHELASLGHDAPDAGLAFRGITALAGALNGDRPDAPLAIDRGYGSGRANLATLLGGARGTGGRI